MVKYKKVQDSQRFSVIHNMDYCICCGKPREHIHEVFFGINREASKAYGMCVGMCLKHHDMVHNHKKLKPSDIDDLDLRLKKMSQEIFEREHSREEFIEVFHENYL